MSEDKEVLIMRLKSGEYDGTHIMKAWLTIREQDKRIAELEKENADVYGMLDDIQNERLELKAEIAELEEEKLYMQISLTRVRESIGRISAFIENIEYRSNESVIAFNRCMDICAVIDEMDLPEFEFKGGAE